MTSTHLSGERGAPVSSAALLAEHATDPATGDLALTVLLGPASDVGRALLERRPDRARALLHAWMEVLPRGSLVIEVVHHGGPEGTPASLGPRGAPAGRWPREAGLPAVLTAAVRHAEPGDAVTVDVLDAARRLVPLDPRHLDRVTTAGHLSSTERMRAVAREVTRAAGAGVSGGATAERERADRLLADTVALARACAQDSRTDLGIGAVHLPEPSVLGLSSGDVPQEVLAARCRGAIATRYAGSSPSALRAVESRLEDELEVIAGAGLPDLLHDRGGGRRPDPRHGGAGRRPGLRGRQPGQLPARHQRGRADRATA